MHLLCSAHMHVAFVSTDQDLITCEGLEGSRFPGYSKQCNTNNNPNNTHGEYLISRICTSRRHPEAHENRVHGRTLSGRDR